MVYFRGDQKKLAVVTSCQVVRVEDKRFYHLCDTGPGTSRAPILTRDGHHIIGLHYSRSVYGGESDRADVLLTAIKGIAPF